MGIWDYDRHFKVLRCTQCYSPVASTGMDVVRMNHAQGNDDFCSWECASVFISRKLGKRRVAG